MSKAKFDQETRDFIEKLFKVNNYSLEKQIKYLEIEERQKYNYNCDCTNFGYKNGWTEEQAKKYDNEWNEIIEMLNERKLKAGAN